MKELTLKLTVQELQLMLRALGNLPYIQVQELIGNLQLQATPQLQNMKEAGQEDNVPEKSAKKAV